MKWPRDETRHPPWGGLCRSHRRYSLACTDFDALWEYSSGLCGICLLDGKATAHGMLHIDHDYDLGYHAVRGLLCSRCNTSLHRDQVLDCDSVRAYLTQPWHVVR